MAASRVRATMMPRLGSSISHLSRVGFLLVRGLYLVTLLNLGSSVDTEICDRLQLSGRNMAATMASSWREPY
jgi:hypothetical protein